MKEDVKLSLSPDEALVFFEWISRGNSTGNRDIQDQAEQRVLWDLEAALESELSEPLESNYGELVAAARARVRDPVE